MLGLASGSHGHSEHGNGGVMGRVVHLSSILALVVGFGAVPTLWAVPLPTAAASSVFAVPSSSPRPGQFCSRSSRGDVVHTAAYGRLKCKLDPRNGRYSRWYRV